MKTLSFLVLAAAVSSLAHAGVYDYQEQTGGFTDYQPSSRIVPPGCDPTAPIDACAPAVKPFDCAPGKHWTNQGGNGLAHCVADDLVCAPNYSLTHDSLGNPSCIYNPPAPVAAPAPVTTPAITSGQSALTEQQAYERSLVHSSGWVMTDWNYCGDPVDFTIMGVTLSQMDQINRLISQWYGSYQGNTDDGRAMLSFVTDQVGVQCTYSNYTLEGVIGDCSYETFTATCQ